MEHKKDSTFEMQKSIQALKNSFEHFYDAQKGCLNLSMMRQRLFKHFMPQNHVHAMPRNQFELPYDAQQSIQTFQIKL